MLHQLIQMWLIQQVKIVPCRIKHQGNETIHNNNNNNNNDNDSDGTGPSS